MRLHSHAFIWTCVAPERLSTAEQDVIADPENDVFVSAASAWEIAIKQALGRIALPIERFDEFSAGMGLRALAMTPLHGIAAGGLPRHHDDPFDRMLIAQARVEGLTLLTRDRKIPNHDVAVFGLAER